MKRLIWIFALLSIVAMTTSLFVACAGNQAGMYSEEGLYTGEDVPDDQVAASSDEDEVLRLLGIADEDQPAVTETTTPVDDQQILQEEIGRLENEVSVKDKELQNLKSQLEEKDAKIQEKEQLLAQTRVGGTYTAPTGSSFKARYDEALRLYNSRRYNEGIAVFNQLLASGENNSLVDNCQYWKGECYYGMGNYEQAILEFQKVFAFPNSNKFDDAQLKLGLCYMQMNNYERARAEFNKLLREYPSSEYASRAQSYLSRL
ncbi:tetratricopeptide repeat protein [candidate division KSB1 bacterium]|nr:tetratricopeptide repeat protein [candidate division KSB1 bacterium]RQV99906.1 MAG: tetratricopeptide repeat protein [candidate division KSB1 bacterium]